VINVTPQGAKKLTNEEKIAALLRKAETTTPGEAELLTAKAEELMLKYGIDRALLNARTTGDKERIQTLRIPFSGIYSKAYMRMMSVIAKSYGDDIDTYYSQWKNDITLTIVGFESDISQLKILLTSLQLQVVVALNTWWNERDTFRYTAMEKFKDRRTFIQSFGQGAASRIARARVSAVKEAEKTTPGAEIVLRDRALAIKDFMKANVGDLKSVKNREKSGGYGASSAGYQAGKNANTGDRQVNAGRRAIEA
jgi:hypothetical protein